MREKIVIIGAGILDVLVRPAKEEVFKKGSVPVENIKLSTGGDALNEAVVAARLKNTGTETRKEAGIYLVSLVGRDEAGEMVLSRCREEGISTEYIIRDADIETGINVVMVQEDGNRSFFTNPKSSLRGLGIAHIPECFPKDAGILCLASIFVSPLLKAGELAEIFKRAREQGMIVCADMTTCKNGEQAEELREAFSYLDYLFANREEAQRITGREGLSEMADVLLACGVKNVLIKCGGGGCYTKNRQGERQFPAVPDTRCIDTTGAGDSFAGGFLCALSEGKSFEECMAWANACGSLATEAVGACTGVQSREQMLERRQRL